MNGLDGVIPMVFGQILGDLVHSHWLSITLEGKESNMSGHLSVGGLRSTNTTEMDANWLLVWPTEGAKQRTIRVNTLNQSSRDGVRLLMFVAIASPKVSGSS